MSILVQQCRANPKLMSVDGTIAVEYIYRGSGHPSILCSFSPIRASPVRKEKVRFVR